ncbi:hypothetical protein PROFUN_08042 [Planoprotostelium fungivorum]|uniref:2-dehydropantoate 2-reductase n=1 Tax=Planoprotostelium fungivorum TaxID=1890364 RepID=A0A2P6NKG3_9EUKA|nr:hypothetical protein PROFUN_08042 [Planoprotostelium fungivorum]
MSGGQETRILIVGTGAVGGFYGSRMHQPPQTKVSVLCRSNYNAVKEKGITLKTRDFGDYHFQPHAVFRNIIDAARDVSYDYLIVTAKALPDVVDDSAEIEPLVRENTCIVLIQNGVGVEEPYRNRYPKNVIISAVTVISAEQIEHGVIRQNRWTRITMGPYYNGHLSGQSQTKTDIEEKSEAQLRRLAELLQRGGIRDAKKVDEEELQMTRWHKIAINGSMNPSSVLSNGCGNAAMSLDSELRIHLKGVMEEVRPTGEVLRTAPLVLGREWPSKGYATSEEILKSTERNTEGRPSMLVDWENHRPMEIEVILGNPIRIARSKGIEMPRLQSLYALIKMAQQQRDKMKSRL